MIASVPSTVSLWKEVANPKAGKEWTSHGHGNDTHPYDALTKHRGSGHEARTHTPAHAWRVRTHFSSDGSL